MKRIFKFWLVWCIALAMGMAASAQTNEGLRAIVEKLNSKCPIALNHGVTQQSVELNDTAVIYTIIIDAAETHFHEMEGHRQLMHDAKAMELATDASPDALAPYCIKLKISVIYHFTDGQEHFDLVIKPEDMEF
ncbi:MAG: hypothetical protein LIP03_05675 [Bacteroidales bacterium]|nr:hypothetical protein [Bacteroidales bacterium]